MAYYVFLLIPSVMSVLLEFSILATPKVISWWALTYDSTHSLWLYNATPLGDQDISTIAWYSVGTHYPDIEPSDSNNAERLARKWQVSIFKSSVWLIQGSTLWVGIARSTKTGDDAQLIGPSCLVLSVYKSCVPLLNQYTADCKQLVKGGQRKRCVW